MTITQKPRKYRSLLWLFILSASGCAADLEHIPFDQKDRFCGQQCSKQYSTCQSEWTALAPYQSYRCGEDLDACVTACPPLRGATPPPPSASLTTN